MTFILTALSLRESLWAIYLRAMASLWLNERSTEKSLSSYATTDG